MPLEARPRCEQRLDPGADHRARLVERHRRDAVAAQDDVERVDQVGRGVDQRSVEVEHDGWGGHGAALARGRGQGKAERGLAHRRSGPYLRVSCRRKRCPLWAGVRFAQNPRVAAFPMNAETYKREAAAGALDFVEPGMRLGLGTGSTARPFVELLGERVRAGLDVVAVPTSEATRAQAEQCGIPLTTLDETPELDLTVDGADEIAPDLTLIKGGGGALLREKIVAAASRRMVVIADESKWVAMLGQFPLPIEVVPFGLAATKRAVEAAVVAAGCPGPISLRRDKAGHAFVTDGGHFILDAALQRIADPRSLAERLAAIPGVVEHGLFIGLAHAAVIAGPEGRRIVERP